MWYGVSMAYKAGRGTQRVSARRGTTGHDLKPYIRFPDKTLNQANEVAKLLPSISKDVYKQKEKAIIFICQLCGHQGKDVSAQNTCISVKQCKKRQLEWE
jgi:hypothetical protein